MAELTASPWRDRRTFVTGAGGLFGSALVRELVDRDAEVVALLRDRVAWSDIHRSDLEGRSTVVWGDITDIEAMTRAINEYECSAVFHLAAQPIVGAASRDPVSSFESNVRGTWTVLEAARRSGCVEALVFVSSDKAYGVQEDLPYHEDDELEGREVYEATKVAAEAVCRPYVTTFGMRIGIARCGNLFGAGDLNWNRLVPGTIRSVLRDEPPVVRSDGTPVRDFFYARDAARGLIVLWEALGAGRHVGEAFNFSREEPSTVLEMVREILTAAGRQDLEPVVLGGAKDEIPAQHLSSEKARDLLGWRPAWSTQDALEQTVAWYRDLLRSTADDEVARRG